MRKLLTVVVYTLVMLMIGRNLPFLPRFTLFSDNATAQKEATEKLKTILNKDFEKFPGNYSYFYSNLITQENIGNSEKETFTAASVNKVPIIIALYYLNKQGKIDLDEQITIQKDDIQDYGTGSLRYQTPGGTYSLKTLAKLSLRGSDNTAAHVIANKIGVDVIQQIAKKLGATQTDIINNKTTTYDMYILLKKLYRNEIADLAKTQEILSFMKNTDVEDRIPNGLSGKAIAYHKTGDGLGSINDVGIITDSKHTYYLGILTSDVSGHEKDVSKILSLVSKHIYESLNQKE